jgi:mannose-6-phosphate isomerase
VYAFSRASELGAGDWARSAAQHGNEFMQHRCWDSRHGGWFHRTTLAGEPLDTRKDLYDHAFAIFALSHHYRAFREGQSLALARETLGLVQERLRDAKHGGFLEAASEDWRPLAEPRRQNPHMHLVEALLALHEVAPDAGALREAEALVELLAQRWVDRQGALRESFEADWRPAGSVVEPGHHFEWTWILHRFAELGGRGDAAPLADRLFDFASRHGVDADGGVFDQIEADGRLVTGTKRLWPQTERVKALACRGDRTELAAALAYCARRHVDPLHGGWHEQLARDGTVLSEAQNATSVYHVVFALSEAMGAGDPV